MKRIAIIGGDRRIESDVPWPRDRFDLRFFQGVKWGGAGEYQRLHDAIRAGHVDAVVILTKWNGHSVDAFKKYKVPVHNWPGSPKELAANLDRVLGHRSDAMNNPKEKKRTSATVRAEIAILETQHDRALIAVSEDALREERAIRTAMAAKVGEVARTFTEPEMKRILQIRDASRQQAKKLLDAAVAAANGEHKKTLREIDTICEVGRDGVNAAERLKNSEFETRLRDEQARIAKRKEERRQGILEKFEEAIKPLGAELHALEAESAKTTKTSEIPLTGPLPKKAQDTAR